MRTGVRENCIMADKMLAWKIDGKDLPPIVIEATSFDEALKEARKKDLNYCGGQVIEEGREE